MVDRTPAAEAPGSRPDLVRRRSSRVRSPFRSRLALASHSAGHDALGSHADLLTDAALGGRGTDLRARPRLSHSAQASTILPSFHWSMLIPVTDARAAVGARPASSPRRVPSACQRSTTLSPAAITSSTVTRTSGKALAQHGNLVTAGDRASRNDRHCIDMLTQDQHRPSALDKVGLGLLGGHATESHRPTEAMA